MYTAAGRNSSSGVPRRPSFALWGRGRQRGLTPRTRHRKVGPVAERRDPDGPVVDGPGATDEPPDTVSDPGVEGGVDAPNEGTEDP